MNRFRLFASAVLLAALVAPAAASAQDKQQNTPKNQPTAAPKQPAKHDNAAVHSEGERIFEQNCSRCHNAPDGFPPSISGTVVRHMRVRASLSRHDEEELLRFFNP
jgi:cytochrome c5